MLLVLLLVGPAWSQEGTTPAGDASGERVGEPDGTSSFEPSPLRELEIAFSDESFWIGFSTPLERVEGDLSFGLLANEDDDFMGKVALTRRGRPTMDERLELGVGIGFYALFPDVRDDDEAFSFTLQGSARYGFETELPTSLGLELAYGPPVTTFGDGDDLFDVRLGFDVEIASHASAFLGYRFVELDLEDSGDRELDDRVHVGVRLGF